MRALRRIGFAALVLSFGVVCAAAQQQSQSTRIRGTIEKADGGILTVKPRAASAPAVQVKLADDLRVTGIVKASLADIKSGSYIGVTGLPQQDGSQKALGIHIFQESQRGVGEGFHPYDARPNSTMTNATVSDMVTGNDGHTLTVKYKGGEKKIVTDAETVVVSFAPGDRNELTPGAKVIVSGTKQPDGGVLATRVSVGRDGLTPPM